MTFGCRRGCLQACSCPGCSSSSGAPPCHPHLFHFCLLIGNKRRAAARCCSGTQSRGAGCSRSFFGGMFGSFGSLPGCSPCSKSKSLILTSPSSPYRDAQNPQRHCDGAAGPQEDALKPSPLPSHAMTPNMSAAKPLPRSLPQFPHPKRTPRGRCGLAERPTPRAASPSPGFLSCCCHPEK